VTIWLSNIVASPKNAVVTKILDINEVCIGYLNIKGEEPKSAKFSLHITFQGNNLEKRDAMS